MSNVLGRTQICATADQDLQHAAKSLRGPPNLIHHLSLTRFGFINTPTLPISLIVGLYLWLVFGGRLEIYIRLIWVAHPRAGRVLASETTTLVVCVAGGVGVMCVVWRCVWLGVVCVCVVCVCVCARGWGIYEQTQKRFFGDCAPSQSSKPLDTRGML